MEGAKHPISESVLAEIQRKFGRPYPKFGIDDALAQHYIDYLKLIDQRLPVTMEEALVCFTILTSEFVDKA